MPRSDASRTRRAEFLGLVSFALALMLLISLATYNPRDPAPFFKAGASGPARNFIGPIGAFLAELLIPQLFGMAALLLPLVLGSTGWKLFWCRPDRGPLHQGRRASCSLLLSLTALLTLTFGTVTFEGEPVRAGGAIGELLAGAADRELQPHRRLHRGRDGALRLADPRHAVLLRRLPGGSRRPRSATRAARRCARRGRTSARPGARRSMRREVIRKHAEGRATSRGGAAARCGASKARRPAARRRGRARGRRDDLPLQARPPRRAGPRRSRCRFALAHDAAPLREDEPEADAPRRRRRGAAEDAAPRRAADPRQLHAAAAHDPRRAQARARRSTRTRLFEKAKILQGKCGRVRRDGQRGRDPPRARWSPPTSSSPTPGVKYSKIVGLADDLALALEAESIRIDRMSGRGTVGIEIPNEVRETIYAARDPGVRRLPQGASAGSPSALGKTVNGETYVDRPRHHAPPADRRRHRHRQERRPQLHDREHPLQGHARRGAHDPDRPQAARARGLRGHPAPADARWSPTPRSRPTSSSGR